MKKYSKWSAKWDDTKSHYDNTLALLSDYSGCPTSGIALFTGGQMIASANRFFSGSWGNHHGAAVQSALQPFYNSSYLYYDCDSVKTVLTEVKKVLRNASIDDNGDLAAIFAVIKQKTTCDYKSINEDDRKLRYGNS